MTLIKDIVSILVMVDAFVKDVTFFIVDEKGNVLSSVIRGFVSILVMVDAFVKALV